MEANPTKAVLTAHEAAALARCSVGHIYHLVRRGECPGRRMGRKYAIPAASFLRWLDGDGPTEGGAASATWK